MTSGGLLNTYYIVFTLIFDYVPGQQGLLCEKKLHQDARV
jgi:hypothetical protein